MIRLSRAQSREIDRLCIEAYGLPGIVLMENAAREVVRESAARFDDCFAHRGPMLVVCGGGNNGGDGYAIARHLANAAQRVTILATKPREALLGDARTMADVAHAMQLPVLTLEAFETDAVTRTFGMFFDCLFGTGLNKPPTGSDVEVISAINRRDPDAVVIAVDVPSGMDCDSGSPLGATVRADLTVTMATEKIGFANPASRQYTGDIVVADIGCPREVIDRVVRP
jgi:NAD(P)H-hydrate epimerase